MLIAHKITLGVRLLDAEEDSLYPRPTIRQTPLENFNREPVVFRYDEITFGLLRRTIERFTQHNAVAVIRSQLEARRIIVELIAPSNRYAGDRQVMHLIKRDCDQRIYCKHAIGVASCIAHITRITVILKKLRASIQCPCVMLKRRVTLLFADRGFNNPLMVGIRRSAVIGFACTFQQVGVCDLISDFNKRFRHDHVRLCDFPLLRGSNHRLDLDER